VVDVFDPQACGKHKKYVCELAGIDVSHIEDISCSSTENLRQFITFFCTWLLILIMLPFVNKPDMSFTNYLYSLHLLISLVHKKLKLGNNMDHFQSLGN